VIVYTVNAVGTRHQRAQHFATRSGARLFALLSVRASGDEATITIAATSHEVRGAALVLAALNDSGWADPGSVREVERWTYDAAAGEPVRVDALAARLARDSKDELQPREVDHDEK
jgi:hypothetical protein